MRPTEQQVRDHLADLNVMLDFAGCTGMKAEFLMRTHAALLTWVLEGDADVQKLVDDTRRDADLVRTARKARRT